MTKDKELKYKCEYCNRKIHKFEYENFNGLCGKCKEIQELKSLIKYKKEFEEKKE